MTEDPVYYAAKGGVPSVLQALLKHGIVRIARDPQGQTALHVAVKGDAPIDPDNTGQPRGVVRSNYPMQGFGIYYFEVTVERSDSEKIIGIGFCDEKAPLNRMLGWDRESWGYHGDDGCIFQLHIFGSRFGELYDAKNVIGCGVNVDENIAFYTKDGKVIGRAFSGVRGKLYPAVSMNTGSAGCKVSANFGDDPGIEFLFKGPFDAPETFEPVSLEESDTE